MSRKQFTYVGCPLNKNGLEGRGSQEYIHFLGVQLAETQLLLLGVAISPAREQAFTRLRRAKQSGRPRASPGFVKNLEHLTSRRLRQGGNKARCHGNSSNHVGKSSKAFVAKATTRGIGLAPCS